MASYSVSGSKIVFAGTDITPTFIHTSVNASGVTGASSSKEENYNYGDSYVINANIVIGSSTTAGDDTILLIKEDNVTFNCDTFDLFGKMQIGDSSTSGNPKETSTVIINIKNGNTNKDKFILKTDSKLIGYGGTFKHNSRVRCETRCLVDFFKTQMSVADGFSTGEGSSYGTNQTIKLRYCYCFGSPDVAFKFYTRETDSNKFPTFDITGSLFVDSLYGIQFSGMSADLIDVGLNTNTAYVTPNLGNAIVRILNPDFTVLKLALHNTSDRFQLLFRYNLKIQDTSDNFIEGARVFIKDETNLVVTDGVTGTDGKVIDFQNIGGRDFLTHSRWSGSNSVSHKATILAIFKYGYQLVYKTFNVDEDKNEDIKLINSINVTESNQSTVESYSLNGQVDSLEKFLDASYNWKEQQTNIHKPSPDKLLVEPDGKKLKLNVPNLTLYDYKKFIQSPAYAIGDRCINGGTLYKCITATTDNTSFTASQWEATTSFEVTSDTITINCDKNTSTINKFNEVIASGIVETNGMEIDWSYVDVNGDSTLLFEDQIDEWEIYSNESNRASETNAIATGTSNQYRFIYTTSINFYLRLRKGELWFKFDKTNDTISLGPNLINYNIQALQEISLNLTRENQVYLINNNNEIKELKESFNEMKDLVYKKELLNVV